MTLLSDLGRLPGMGSVTSTTETNFLAAPSGQHHTIPMELVSTTADAGNTPTTTLRAGLLLGRITATGLFKEYNPVGTDGSEVCRGILYRDVNTLDLVTATAGSRLATMVVKGIVYADQVFLLDEQARRQLFAQILFLDRLSGPDPGAPLLVVPKTADYTVVNDTDTGKLFTNRGAVGAVNFTLPTTLKQGQRFRFSVEADQTVTVTAPAGKLVTFNNAAATSVAYSTGGEKIGAYIEIVVNDNASKYLHLRPEGETQTPTVA